MDYQLGPGPLQVDQNTIDEKIKGDIGIVENGDVATHAIPSGYYVIWKGDLYIAKTDISSGTTLSSASNGNLTAKTQGIGADVAALNSNIQTEETFSIPLSEEITDAIIRYSYGTYNPATRTCKLRMFIASNAGLVPVNAKTIATVPNSKYRPASAVQSVAFLIPYASSGWSDVRIEPAIVEPSGVIHLGNFIYGNAATKVFMFDIEYLATGQ